MAEKSHINLLELQCIYKLQYLMLTIIQQESVKHSKEFHETYIRNILTFLTVSPYIMLTKVNVFRSPYGAIYYIPLYEVELLQFYGVFFVA